VFNLEEKRSGNLKVADQKRRITRTHKESGLIEYRTGNAGGWSADKEQAFLFQSAHIAPAIAELRREPDGDAFVFTPE
jgi:hypothetical protein